MTIGPGSTRPRNVWTAFCTIVTRITRKIVARCRTTAGTEVRCSVALSGEGETRLGEFLEWIFLSGVEESRLPDFRRIAAELFDLASGGRVNESHILRLIDARSEGPSG